MKPIIGIVAKCKRVVDERLDERIRDEVKNAVVDNGGIAIGILPTETEVAFNEGDDNVDFLTKQQKSDLIRQIKLCDGIILQGGTDSLKYEAWVAKYVFDHDIPTLGICAGQNAAVRGVGGTTKKIPNPDKHYQKWVDFVHDIHVKKGTKFYDIVKCEKMKVNSRHIRAVDNPTEKYVVSAVCDDGYFDALEAPNKKFNLAIRFHPESIYKQSKAHNAIFKAFIKACKENMKHV